MVRCDQNASLVKKLDLVQLTFIEGLSMYNVDVNKDTLVEKEYHLQSLILLEKDYNDSENKSATHKN